MKYTGIGSRRAPPPILATMRRIGRDFAGREWEGRSGGAAGSDLSFRSGALLVPGAKWTDFRPRPLRLMRAEMDLFDRVVRPLARCKSIYAMDPYTAGLLARNMNQVLGADLDDPSDLVVCWTPTLDYSSFAAGGTRYACLLAEAMKIPIYNLLDETALERLHACHIR